MLNRLKEMVEQVSNKMGCQLIEFNGESDHIHILLDFHPRNSIAAVVGSLKSSSARMLKKEFSVEVEKHYWGKVSFWSNSYYVASCGGAPIEVLKKYIRAPSKFLEIAILPHPALLRVGTAAQIVQTRPRVPLAHPTRTQNNCQANKGNGQHPGDTVKSCFRTFAAGKQLSLSADPESISFRTVQQNEND